MWKCLRRYIEVLDKLPGKRWYTLLLFLFPPIIYRFAALRELGIVDHSIDYFGGTISGLGVSLGCYFVFLTVPQKAKIWTKLILAGLLIFIELSNYEHIIELDANIHFYYVKYIFDPAFIKGSAMTVSSPYLLAVIMAIALFFFGCSKLPKESSKAKIIVIAAMTLFFGINAIFTNGDYRSWREKNAVHDNIVYLTNLRDVSAMPGAEDTEFQPVKNEQVIEMLEQDLRGEKIASLVSDRAQNVLLIIVESLTGGFVEQFAGTAGDPIVKMPRFSNLLRKEGNLYRNFFNHNRKTNRGIYSLLCGDYPNLLGRYTPKMNSYFLAENRQKCLPAVLKAEGYNVAYLQAAKLEFMNKHLFLPAAGFDRFHGFSWFKYAHKKGGWGVDDKALFEQSLDYIKSLNAEGKPWFAALLTVGTHHPYDLYPKEWADRNWNSNTQAAFAYADDSLANLLDGLEKEGLRENTLVIITGDESHHIIRNNHLSQSLTHNWGTMAILNPSRTKEIVDDYFIQSDVSLSILDYLDKAKSAPHFKGRSLFRKYSTTRKFMLANSMSKTLTLVKDTNNVVACTGVLKRCTEYSTNEPVLLWDKNPKKLAPASEDDKKTISDFLNLNEVRSHYETRPGVYELAKKDLIKISKMAHTVNALYRIFSHLPQGWIIKTDIQLEVTKGSVTLFQHLKTNAKHHVPNNLMTFEKKRLKTGEQYNSFSVFQMGKDDFDAIVSLKARVESDQEAELRIKNATVTISPRSVGRDGIVVRRINVIKNRSL